MPGPRAVARRTYAFSFTRTTLSRRRISVFGHVARLDDDTPANVALQLHINVSLNRPPDRTWRRPAHLVVHGTSDATSYETILPVPLETSGGVLSTVDMVMQRRDGPRRLLDDDDDDDDYASAAMALCLSVCLSQVGVVSIRLNESSWFLA